MLGVITVTEVRQSKALIVIKLVTVEVQTLPVCFPPAYDHFHGTQGGFAGLT